MSWLHRLNKLKLLPRRNLHRLSSANNQLTKPKWPLKQLREQDLRKSNKRKKQKNLLLNWLPKKLLKRLRKRLRKKRELESLMSLLLIDNSWQMKRQPLRRRLFSLCKHRNRKQLELLPNKLPQKLLLIWPLLNLRVINKELWRLKESLKRLKKLHWLLKEHLN